MAVGLEGKTSEQAQRDFEEAAAFFGGLRFEHHGGEVITGERISLGSGRGNLGAYLRCHITDSQIVATSGSIFAHCRIEGGSIEGGGAIFQTTMRDCTFVRVQFLGSLEGPFENCTFEGCSFGRQVTFEANARIIQACGLETCTGLELAYPMEGFGPMSRDLMDARLRWWCRFSSTWSDIRGFGSLPFFGLSYAGVPLLLLLIASVDSYNRQADSFEAWATRLRPDLGGLPGFVTQLHRISLSAETIGLLLSGVALMIASTIYAMRCPSRVKEFSLHRWTEELGKSAFQYLPLSWSRPRSRWIALIFYLFGGGGAALVLLCRLWSAFGQIVRNMD